MGIVDFRSFDLNADNTLKSQRSIKSRSVTSGFFIFTVICVSPYYIPSNKKFRLDSTFCKVLFIKSVVFMKSDII